MAMGVPVIVADSGALPGIVQHGETGFIVSPGDPRSLADQIVNTFASSGIRSRMVRAARRRVGENFDADRTAKRIMALYDQILRNRAKGEGAR